MSVGTIRADIAVADTRGAAPRSAGHGAIDFGALLNAMGADGGSATKTESSRSSIVIGSMRRTIIGYTDGTSDMQIGIDHEETPTPNGIIEVAAPSRMMIKPNSDLEPETGIVAANQAPILWRMPRGRATGGAIGVGRGKARMRVTDVEAAADIALLERPVGRLIDMMV